jgi:uncharacterized repeat protein (TIGR03803 family)
MILDLRRHVIGQYVFAAGHLGRRTMTSKPPYRVFRILLRAASAALLPVIVLQAVAWAGDSTGKGRMADANKLPGANRSISGSPSGTFTALYSFMGGTDGAHPEANLILDAAGNLYGTTVQGGGAPSCNTGCGTVFKVDTNGKETVLYSFAFGTDGAFPTAGLIRDAAGNLYGTTVNGGTSVAGTVFKVDTTGKETVLNSFAGGTDGAYPYAGLIRDADGNLYGTTTEGGENSCGTLSCGVVFKVDATGKETVLYRFTGSPDGAYPYAALIPDASGNLYSTTQSGGTSGEGVVFELDSTGKETVLYSFAGGTDGSFPQSGLVRDAAGNLYGTTYEGGGGSNNAGTVFKVDTTGKETVLYNFCSQQGCTDGAYPQAGVIQDAAGSLYGTTVAGGDTNCDAGYGCGTVFKVDTTGKETVLYSFTGGTDGANPLADLIQDANCNLYGTTDAGGANGLGVVFEIKASSCPKVINYFSLPTGSSGSFGITAGPDGALWFNGGGPTNAFVGRITVTGVFTPFTLPSNGDAALGITTGADGAMWFTDVAASSIGRICALVLKPSCPYVGYLTYYSAPNLGAAYSITAGPDGYIWFLEPEANNIGRISTSGVVEEYSIITPNSNPYRIVAGPDGALWFTEGNANNIGRICASVALPSCPSVGYIVEYPVGQDGEPYGITTGPDRALWFTEPRTNQIGRICALVINPRCPAVGHISEYNSTGQQPLDITDGPDGALWFVDNTSSLGRVSTSGVTKIFSMTNEPLSIASGPDGSLWLVGGTSIAQAIPTARRNGVDLSASAGIPMDSVLQQWVQAGVNYAIVEAPHTTHNQAAAQISALHKNGMGTAAYCFLYYDPGDDGTGQAESCLNSIANVLSEVSFVAVDVEVYPGYSKDHVSLPQRIQVILDALAKLSSVGPEVVYTTPGDWQTITNDDLQDFGSTSLWTAAYGDFEGYVDPAGNWTCAGTSYRAQSLTPTLHAGNGLPNLTPFKAFGPWTQRLGTQYDISAGDGKAAACLFGVQVDFDVFDATLFP